MKDKKVRFPKYRCGLPLLSLPSITQGRISFFTRDLSGIQKIIQINFVNSLISARQHNHCYLLSTDVATQGACTNWDPFCGFGDGEWWLHPTVLVCPVV